jgi:hypothetical protein
MLTVVKILLATFLSICVGVHIYGLIYHPFPESDLSHVIHILSYSLCLFTFLRPIKFRLLLYCIGAVYPFFYHARCFFMPLIELHKFNVICLEVIIVLPLAGLLILKQNRPAVEAERLKV